MALGTLTIVEQEKKSASAPLDCISVSFPGDASYPTGGTAAFTAFIRAGLKRNVSIVGLIKNGATGVYTPIFDKANDKLYVEDAAGAQVANATDLSGTVFKLNVLCY